MPKRKTFVPVETDTGSVLDGYDTTPKLKRPKTSRRTYAFTDTSLHAVDQLFIDIQQWALDHEYDGPRLSKEIIFQTAVMRLLADCEGGMTQDVFDNLAVCMEERQGHG